MAKVSPHGNVPAVSPHGIVSPHQLDKPTLSILFEFDPGSGLFFGTLPSGARFGIERTHLGGKLGVNLDLFRAAVLADRANVPFKPTYVPRPIDGDEELIAKAERAGKVRKFDARGKQEITLEDLGL